MFVLLKVINNIKVTVKIEIIVREKVTEKEEEKNKESESDTLGLSSHKYEQSNVKSIIWVFVIVSN